MYTVDLSQKKSMIKPPLRIGHARHNIDRSRSPILNKSKIDNTSHRTIDMNSSKMNSSRDYLQSSNHKS